MHEENILYIGSSFEVGENIKNEFGVFFIHPPNEMPEGNGYALYLPFSDVTLDPEITFIDPNLRSFTPQV